MRVLAFDGSTACGGVAVVEDGVMLFAETFASPRGRGGELFPALDRAVRATGRADRVAVGIGPGSYNGLRATIAAAEALHLAWEVPRVGVPSAAALDGGEDFFALGDARAGQLWLARITAGRVVGDFALLSAAAVRERLEIAPEVPRLATAFLADFTDVPVGTPDVVRLAGLAAALEPAPGPLEPLYLKPAHITQPRAR